MDLGILSPPAAVAGSAPPPPPGPPRGPPPRGPLPPRPHAKEPNPTPGKGTLVFSPRRRSRLLGASRIPVGHGFGSPTAAQNPEKTSPVALAPFLAAPLSASKPPPRNRDETTAALAAASISAAAREAAAAPVVSPRKPRRLATLGCAVLLAASASTLGGFTEMSQVVSSARHAVAAVHEGVTPKGLSSAWTCARSMSCVSLAARKARRMVFMGADGGVPWSLDVSWLPAVPSATGLAQARQHLVVLINDATEAWSSRVASMTWPMPLTTAGPSTPQHAAKPGAAEVAEVEAAEAAEVQVAEMAQMAQMAEKVEVAAAEKVAKERVAAEVAAAEKVVAAEKVAKEAAAAAEARAEAQATRLREMEAALLQAKADERLAWEARSQVESALTSAALTAQQVMVQKEKEVEDARRVAEERAARACALQGRVADEEPALAEAVAEAMAQNITVRLERGVELAVARALDARKVDGCGEALSNAMYALQSSSALQASLSTCTIEGARLAAALSAAEAALRATNLTAEAMAAELATARAEAVNAMAAADAARAAHVEEEARLRLQMTEVQVVTQAQSVLIQQLRMHQAQMHQAQMPSHQQARQRFELSEMPHPSQQGNTTQGCRWNWFGMRCVPAGSGCRFRRLAWRPSRMCIR